MNTYKHKHAYLIRHRRYPANGIAKTCAVYPISSMLSFADKTQYWRIQGVLRV